MRGLNGLMLSEAGCVAHEPASQMCHATIAGLTAVPLA